MTENSLSCCSRNVKRRLSYIYPTSPRKIVTLRLHLNVPWQGRIRGISRWRSDMT